jgi:hypothetical protein
MKQYFLGGMAALVVIVGVVYFLWRLGLTLYQDWRLAREFDDIRASSRTRRQEELSRSHSRLANGCEHQWTDESEGFPPATCRKCGLQQAAPEGACDHIWRPANGPVPGTICEKCGERHAGGALYGGKSTQDGSESAATQDRSSFG